MSDDGRYHTVIWNDGDVTPKCAEINKFGMPVILYGRNTARLRV